jgi:superfamily II DNA or RNA helicase
MTTAASPPFIPTIGSLVRVRERDWVVVGTDGPDVMLLRPLTGSPEIIGISTTLERVSEARFSPPDPSHTGDATGAMLLFDAARLAIRNGAAPFRLLAHVSVDPRAYQFVPLIMALRQENVRLMIADDVGVGKTIEAGMIARELIDRGLARRTAVVCPAHLTRQWAQELKDKFGIDARVVQPSTIGRLNRELPRPDLSLYRYYPHVVVSVDWIKSDNNASQFLRDAPELVIVDEAHMCARPGSWSGRSGGSQHQRYEFVRKLAQQTRHLLLVTATPHSGIEASFRSLVGLLDPSLDSRSSSQEADEPEYSLLADQSLRDRLRKYIVLRRRADLEDWLDEKTPFPQRNRSNVQYHPSELYIRLYDDVVRYCRESIRGAADLGKRQQRVRYWAATAILRCVLSSPAAAQSVLEGRASRVSIDEEIVLDSEYEVDSLFRPQVLDDVDETEASDFAPSAPVEEASAGMPESERARLTSLGRQAGRLASAEHDLKLAQAGALVAELLSQKYSPIVFCQYIATAKYLEEELPKLLFKSRLHQARVKAITGEIGDDERRQRVAELAKEPIRVLVATDCLSEGINLQDQFDAVIHYDLPWNPNRLEQREGRIDRFGQPRDEVRAIRMVGRGTAIDEIVMRRLIEKSDAIRARLGVTVPVPVDAGSIQEAVVDTVLLAGSGAGGQTTLEMAGEELTNLDREWDRAADREEEIRSYFRTPMAPEDVKYEIEMTNRVLGDPASIARFLGEGIRRFGGRLAAKAPGILELSAGDLRPALMYRNCPDPVTITFETMLGAEGRAAFAGRTHPAVETLADTILGRSLSPEPDPAFPRCGALYTTAVQRVTTILLLHLRYRMKGEVEEYAEEVVLEGFRSDPHPVWLEGNLELLLSAAKPTANMSPEEKTRRVSKALETLKEMRDWFESPIERRVAQLRSANNRLRALTTGADLDIDPHLPPDLIGMCVLVPGAS